MRYTSRSAIEIYQDCPRYRYNNYHLLGRGLVPTSLSVPLETGSGVHRGIEHLANRVRIGEEPSVDTAVGLAIQEYEKECADAGFSGRGLQTERQQWFTFNEQRALIEALIRAWAIVELPQLTARFKILAVEREVTPLQLVGDVYLMAKVDMELQEIASGDYYNYSLKTAKQWNERMEESYKNDLQGITETWAVEQESRMLVAKYDNVASEVEELIQSQQFPNKNLLAITEWLKKNRRQPKILSGIRFCYLIKGIRKKPDYYADDDTALYITYNPLIRGYKNIGPSSISYAHSWFYPNPENKSGKSALGKGWEPFNVWESDISIKQWIEAIAAGQVQPECGDVLRQHVVTPTEYFRNENEIKEGIREIRFQEQRIHDGLLSISDAPDIVLADVFNHHRKSCNFMYGEKCAYNALCWKSEVAEDPIGSGLYQLRTAHHEAERVQHETNNA